MQLTRKVRIYPSKEQINTLWVLSDRCRLIYNFALAERQERWEREQKSVSYVDQQNKLPEIKEEYPEYKQVHSKVLQMTLKTLDANYKSFFALTKVDPEARPPGFRGRKYFFTMKYNQSGFKVTNEEVTLSHKIKGGADLAFPTTPCAKFTDVKQVEVHYNEGKWYLSIVDEIEPPEYHDNGLYQAFDLGVTKQTAVNLAGKFFEKKNIRPDLYWNKRIDKITSRRDHCIKHTKTNSRPSSRQWIHLNNIKRKFERKRSNQILDFQHKTSKMIVENTRANTIIVGDLDVKSMPQSEKANRRLNRSTQGTGYLARFAGFLTYKAEKAGKKVIEISERNTTKACCKCGKLHDMPPNIRVMKCDCGNVIDRDRNAAVNIMVRFLSQNAMWTCYRQFADNLRKTGLEIPVHSQEIPPLVGGGIVHILVI
jgi:putative transposase